MNNYLLPLKHFFEKNADPGKAVDMGKYMKNRFQFFGIPSSIRTDFYNTYFKHFGKPEKSEIEMIVNELWIQPQREYQYFAMEILKKLNREATRERILLYEFMITNSSWWDTVDFIASNLVGPFFVKFPELKNEFFMQWMNSGNMWLQRTTLLFQLKYKMNTDKELLTSAIMELKSSKEFFIRKAIGWALREYSKVNSEFVYEFVEINRNKLSPLSVREALKIINKKGMKPA